MKTLRTVDALIWVGSSISFRDTDMDMQNDIMIMSTMNEEENVISEAGLLAEHDRGLKHNVMVTAESKSLARSSQHACVDFGPFVWASR